MKAIAVLPGKAGSVHLAQVPKPNVADVKNGRGVLVKILRVGVDGTDKEINAAEYGAAPDGSNYLILGHESFGRVEEIGPRVRNSSPAITSPSRCAAPVRVSTTRLAPTT